MEKSKPYDDCKINYHAAEPKAEGQRHWDRDDPRMTNQWPPHQYNEGQSGNENRSQYRGQMAHQNTGVEKRIEQDMEIGYEDKPSLLTLETLEKKFHDEIMKLAKEESDAEDAENVRHKEKKTEISNQYLEKLTALRVLQAKQREEFLYKETQEQLNQYHHQQQENYTSSTCSPGKGGNHGDQNTMVKDIHVTPVSSPFGSSISASSPTVFSFSAQTPASGLSTVATSLPVSPFCFTSAAKTENYTGGPTCSPGKGGSHSDHNTMVEDSMAEDVVQVASTHAPTPSPVSNPSPSPFMFGSTVPSTSTGVNPFQFGGQQSQPSVQNPNPFGQPGLQNSNPFGQPSVQNPNPFGQQNQPGLQNPNPFGQQNQPSVQNPNPFGQQNQPSVQNPNPFGQQNVNQFAQQSQPGIQNPNPFGQQSLQNPNPFDPSGSQDFGGGGGSFSLGSGGGERSGRRIIKVKRKNGKK